MRENNGGESGSSTHFNRNASKVRAEEMHSQTVGERGPVLEQDSILHETLETFVHSTILERPVHVKGFGAFGYFETVYSMAKYTKLCFYKILGSKFQLL